MRQQINDPALTQLGLETQIAFFKTLAVDTFEQDGILAVTLGFEDPVINAVLHTQIEAHKLKESIEKISAFFAKYNVSWSWVLNPFFRPANLADCLQQQGF